MENTSVVQSESNTAHVVCCWEGAVLCFGTEELQHWRDIPEGVDAGDESDIARAERIIADIEARPAILFVSDEESRRQVDPRQVYLDFLRDFIAELRVGHAAEAV